MRYEVYHALSPNFGMGEPKEFPLQYELVAVVECTGLEDVFEKTNHIDHAWTDNPEVVEQFIQSVRQRSTSVGDVVAEVGGKAFRCEGCGWKEISR